jgi:hypothetical protein
VLDGVGVMALAGACGAVLCRTFTRSGLSFRGGP